MSFIVIWLHFFLQTGNRGEALAQKPQLLLLITQDHTDLHGSEKSTRNHFGFINPCHPCSSVVRFAFAHGLQIAERFRLLLGRRRSLLFRNRVVDNDLLHALIVNDLRWLRRSSLLLWLLDTSLLRACRRLTLLKALLYWRCGKRNARRFAVIFPLG